MGRWHDVVDSPIGPLTVSVVDGEDGGEPELTGVFFEQHRHPVDPAVLGARDAGPIRRVRIQLEEYFTGDREAFDVPLAPAGTPFQLTVWRALRDIPYGETIDYGELARRIGRPTASRAVGAANGRNPISIVVPCHRVIGSTGTLTGYGGGVERKQALLDLEQRGRRLF
ncbi:methylated-DNA--[protein]-cysteine S-methyltransferase [Euzebya rosea]|uniref:methylated-DNA--[protein]-cysteine S-methyltransferase n=1 Tax=Euzebya rosea TaxID=2052804 RepID=UPI000D3E8C3D|nr:methylated-DNA--[protein]-cysteine S-methyltransferase [Euzebya rosea]